MAFGGKVTGRNFGVDGGAAASFDVRVIRPMLAAIAERLAGVVLEQLTWSAFIDRYDREGAFFYLDPPYWGCETDYGEGMFSRDDFAAMAERLARLKGRFLLSINDRPEVREIFAGFTIEAAETTYGVSRQGQTRAAELLISGEGQGLA